MLVKVAYIPKILVLTPIFMVGNLFFLPFGYVIGVFTLFRNIWLEKSKSVPKKLFDLIIFMLFSPFILIIS